MARTLDVYLEQEPLGQLIQDDDGQITFGYAASWLEKDGAFAISHSLPLRPERFTQKECKGIFGGLLPEEGNRKVIARILQISDQNDFAMLERIGGECAGALTFLPHGDAPPTPDNNYRELTDKELADILRTLPSRPLLAGEKGVRLSLAGAQDKIAVRVDASGRISLPLGYAPSTHVLKPAIATWEGIVSNEVFCMRLARAVGLTAAETTAHQTEDEPYLLSPRHDRAIDHDGTVRRLHQEDFCQALGVPSEIKYQTEGGPGLKDCFALLRRASSNPVQDLLALLDAVIFNLLIGNNDGHAKNFALLYGADGVRRLAPLYDLVSTVYYPEIDNTLAMKIGGEANPDLVFGKELEAFARDAGLAPAGVKRRVSELAERVRLEAQEMDKADETAEKLAALISRRCERHLVGRQ
jgi:serine/threonine-protein kinase HipA